MMYERSRPSEHTKSSIETNNYFNGDLQREITAVLSKYYILFNFITLTCILIKRVTSNRHIFDSNRCVHVNFKPLNNVLLDLNKSEVYLCGYSIIIIEIYRDI